MTDIARLMTLIEHLLFPEPEYHKRDYCDECAEAENLVRLWREREVATGLREAPPKRSGGAP